MSDNEEYGFTLRQRTHRNLGGGSSGSDSGDSGDNEGSEYESDSINEVSNVKRGRGRPKKNAIKISLPPIPDFTPIRHTKPFSSRLSDLSETTPLDAFQKFFPDSILKTITINTNYYTAVKDAEENGRREWKPLTISELLIFVAICIYFGIVHASGSLELQ